jgi:protein-tyrosine-phosphatase
MLVTQIARRLRAEFTAIEAGDPADHRSVPGIASPTLARDIIDRLAPEFADVLDRRTVEHHVAAAVAELASGGPPGGWLPPVVERFAGDRLRAVRRRQEGDLRRPAVLFLGRHGTRCAPMAAGWMRRMAGHRVDVFTGSTEPAPRPDPAAIQAMAEEGVDIAGHLPHPAPSEVLAAVDLVVVMDDVVARGGPLAGLAPSTVVQRWPFVDGAGVTVEQLRPLRDEIGRRVAALVAKLPPAPG